MGGGFPIELILFAMIAAFLVLRLRSVLGRRTGYERPPAPEAGAAGYDPRGGRVLEGEAQEVWPAAPQGQAKRVVPDPRTPPGQALARIAAQDRSFQPERFLEGAEGAFRMVIQAFATGDRQTLRALLSDDTYAGFEQAITAREQAGEQQRTELRAVHELAIEEADLRGSVADVTVRFVTDQINMTVGRGGEVVAGSDAITELTDLWTFQRDLTSADPTWKLVATRSL
ncbi:Tim44/TimA family putative adaptor protein [Siccirubricoccus sp. KC 17139]|uniref:Tim44/TimA family putative adaptor protein n=1 Tax=Siccirubricoccus soli TaxID=2899147 RepID=A0ABT1DCK8_9PROT|nr:Tim44/TimA family putative adaptor protein [Siccirubricoccus soli]MCO6419667.1 Tim44/TimA family putative adaptor protein [Siccirubricoccus soli]MCP2685802.1 Tim44/TimA family putative adaptor protein [Siccirubricoccus soli]